MPIDFLPSLAADITDPDAIAALQQLQRQIIQVRFQQNVLPVSTAYIHQSNHRLASEADSAPILLLHGFDSSLLEFCHLLPRLATRREIWALDLFGFGFTEYVSTIAVNPQTIRQHLHAVIKTWIGQPVTLVGASLGGAIAIDFTLNYPDWVRSLILIDSVGFSGSFPLGQYLTPPLLDWGVEWLHIRKQAALTTALALTALTGRNSSTLVDAIRCSLLHQEMPGWRAATASFTQSGGYEYLSNLISHVQHPTLILWGEADDVLGTIDAHKFEQTIVNSTLRWIKQAGHAPHFDQPQQVADWILASQET